MLSAKKKLKLSKENECYIDAESGFHSQVDFSSTNSEFSLPPVKRKSLNHAPRRASLQQFSFNSTDTQQSSGYSSLQSSLSNSTNVTGSTSTLGRTSSSRTPKKRKSEISESDENFYNSFQFVSPLKIRKKDPNDKNCAKLILKEKSSSENVILSSTPIRNNNSNKNAKWGKFRSFHPEKFQCGKNLEEENTGEAFEKISIFGKNNSPKSLAENSSLNLSSFDFSNASLELSQHTKPDIPENFQNLWTNDIKQQQSSLKHTQATVHALKEEVLTPFTSTSFESSERRDFYNGRSKLNIMGLLHSKRDIAVEKILSFLDSESLSRLSNVSKEYRNMIQSNKNYDIKLQNYLKAQKAIKENTIPSYAKATLLKSTQATSFESEQRKKKAFANHNINQESKFNQKPIVAPQSPSSTRFNEMRQAVQSHQKSTFKKCPKCCRPARIDKIEIRISPRKKKSNIYKLSKTYTGRVQKRTRTFLSKTSIESFNEVSDPLYVTMASLDDDSSKSPKSSSSFESPGNSSGTDDTSNITGQESSMQEYEYGICTGAGCSYRFCVKCNCKYHPKRICGDLSPPSPSRFSRTHAACTRASLKSLKRLAY